jgi:hypothetical protein
MVAEPAPKPWQSPVSPVVVERRYRDAAPYMAGARRTVRLRASPGQLVAAPCTGAVSFRGAVAGSPPLVTLRCASGDLRATVQGVRAVRGRGALIERGDGLGPATGRAVGLSARGADGLYLDPLPLLGSGRRRLPPLVAGPRPRSRNPLGTSRPAHLPAGAFVVPAGGESVAGAGARSGHRSPAGPAADSDLFGRTEPARRAKASRIDLPLTVAGGLAVVLAAAAGVATGVRRGTNRPGSSRRRELVGAQQ